MAYTPEQRRLLQTKQIRVQVKKGTPLVSELLEGVPVIRSTDSGVYQYVRHNSSLYKVKLDRASDAEVEKSSLQSNGHMTFSNGFIMQWGQSLDATNPVYLDISFPKVFPNNCFSVQATSLRATAPGSGPYNIGVQTSDFSVATFRVRALGSTGGSYISDGVSWIAIGN